MTGADVLRVLCQHGLMTAREVVRVAGVDGDGRKVARVLIRLERAGLISWSMRTHEDRSRYRVTARGCEVDGILDRIVAARGGSFEPWSKNGITSSEAYALR